MERKTAIAVYNPQEPLEKAVQEAYHKCADTWLTANQIRAFVEGVVAYEGLYEEFLSNPERVCGKIFTGDDGSTLIYIPCYTLDLRQILRKRKIISPYRIAAFRSRPAKQFLTEYPILLVIDESKLKTEVKDTLKGVVIYDKTLALEGALIRILVRERADSDCAQSVDRIVQEEYPEATVHPLTEPPGLAPMKAASVLDKYVINISSLGIKDEVIKGYSPEEAVNEALTRAWQQTGNSHREPQFTIEYWQQSGYWPMIVKQASKGTEVLEFMLPPKHAQSWYEQMKDTGEKPETVDWLCGNVIIDDFAIGTKTSKAIILDTGVERLKLRHIGSEPYDDSALKGLVGKGICAKGFRNGYTFLISEFKIREGERGEDVLYMERVNPDVLTNYEVGDHVRRRQRGMAFPQIDGEVERINNGLMYVKWKDVGELEVFKLSDAVTLSRMLEKV